MLLLKLLVFAIPPTIAAIGHMVVVKLKFLHWLTYPLDFNATFKGKRIFGDSKTFRGLVIMVLFSVPSSCFLYWLTSVSPAVAKYSIINFHDFSPSIIGIAYGLGYVIAELPNSFIKRQIGIEEGKRGGYLNIIIDQADSPIGCMLALYPFSSMSLMFFVVGSVFFVGFHMFFNVLLYSLGLRKNPL